MLTMVQLQKEWEIDAPVNDTHLGNESARIPVLHSKYLGFLMEYKNKLFTQQRKLRELRREKISYYNGEMTQQELQERGWRQYQGIKPAKAVLNEILDLDPDMMKQHDRVVYYDIGVSFLEEVISQINKRTFVVGHMIDWEKFRNGLN